MATTFPALANNFGRTLATAHTSGSGTFVLSSGSRTELLAALAKLGYSAPSASQPLRFTAFKVDENGVFTGNAADLTIYSATGMTSETLTGCTAVEGTTDQDFPVGSAVEVLITAGTLARLAAAVNTLEAAGFLTADGDGSGLTGLTQSQIAGLSAALAAKADTSAVLLKASNLSDLASASTARSNLGLVIGTNVLAPNGSGATLTGIDHGNLVGLADDDHGQYHTNARALAWLGTRTTADLPEGANQYHTSARVNTLIASAVGVSVQAYSATLAGLAGATYASGALLGGDGSGVPTAITLGANLTLTDGVLSAAGGSGGGGSGTVTTVSVATANGVSGTVANATTTPAITITLGAITPTSVAASGNVTGLNLSGTNTGDQTITLTGDVTGSGTGAFAVTIGAGKVTASMLAGSIPASKLVGTDLVIAESQVTGLESDLVALADDIASKADSTTVDSLATTVATKAPLASPTFTGTVTIGSLAGLLKGTAGAVGVATAGTDYLAPNGSASGLSNLPLGDTRPITFLLAVDGNALAVGTNLTTVGAIVGHAGTIAKWKCVAGENPSGGGFTFDLKKNGTSIFSAPIAVAANTTAVQVGSTFASAGVAENDLLTVDVTAAGTGVKYVNLTLFLSRTGA